LNTILGVVIAAGCAGDKASPLEPQGVPSWSVTGSLSTVLLSCNPLPATSKSVVVGASGGTISFGPNTLVIPRGALNKSVAITAEVVSGSANSVRFYPEGLVFAKSASLTMSYSNCFGPGKLLPNKIVYTDALLNPLEILSSNDYESKEYVRGRLDHFSRYAIAY